MPKKKSFNVVSGTLRHTEQHTQSWTNTEHGKVKKYDHKKNGFFFFLNMTAENSRVLAIHVFVVIKARLPYYWNRNYCRYIKASKHILELF